jgi:hypothetical protein
MSSTINSMPALPHALYRELTKLVTLRLWGEITPAQMCRLEELVCAHPQGFQVLSNVVLETVALRRLADAAELTASAMAWSPADQMLVSIAAEQFENRTLPAEQCNRWDSYVRQSLKWGSLAAALSLVFWAALAMWVFPRWRADDSQLAVRPAEQVRLANLVAHNECKWHGPMQPVNGGQFLPGRYHLIKGVAEVALQSGVQLVVSAPANFELIDTGVVFLHEGLMSALVPSQAIGFRVQTKLATIVDLGTEFGVGVTPTGDTDVEVFDGEVALTPACEPDVPSAELPRTVVLRAGEVRRVTTSEDGAPVPQVLVIDTMRNPAPRKAKAATVQAVKPPHFHEALVAFWNFDEEHDTVVWDVRGRNHGKPENVERVAGLVGTGALRFTNQPQQYVRVPPFSADFEFADGITIEAAFQSKWSAAHGDYDTLFRKEDGNRLLLAFQNDGDHNTTAFPPAVNQGPVLAFGLTVAGDYQELDLPLDDLAGRPSVAKITDGKLHHVAATYSSKTGTKSIYFDGRLCYQAKYDAGSLISSGGTAPAYLGSNSGNENFSGVLDELAIYREALTAEEIAAHYQRVTSGSEYFQRENANQ